MIVVNFAYPLTETQQGQIEQLTNNKIVQMIDVQTDFDMHSPFAPQVEELLAVVGLTPAQWQQEQILIVLPSLNFITAVLLAELHGNMGYFPTIVRMRPVSDSVPRHYEIAEILDLQAIRDRARQRRER